MKTNQMSVSGQNGQKEAQVGFSTTLGFSIYNEYLNEFNISNTTKNIKLKIPVISSVNAEFIKYDLKSLKTIHYNLTSNLTSNYTYPFLMNKITVNPDANPALFIHIKPNNTNQFNFFGYVLWIRYGAQLNLKNYDDVKVFCPDDLTTQLNETFYLYFSDSIKSKSYVIYGIRELIENEFLTYCVNKNYSKNYFRPSITHFVSFTQEFSLRAFTSSCYFYNKSSDLWSKTNLFITESSTVKYTECLSNHLTDFAGGFIVTPPNIDFYYVLQNCKIYFLFCFFLNINLKFNI